MMVTLSLSNSDLMGPKNIQNPPPKNTKHADSGKIDFFPFSLATLSTCFEFLGGYFIFLFWIFLGPLQSEFLMFYWKSISNYSGLLSLS